MTDERPDDRHGERDSQLSAMFDGELPAGECELLARRLTRDEALRAQWSRYSMIGAALRAERGVALHDRVALRVQAVVSKETTYGDAGADAARATAAVPAERREHSLWRRLATPLMGASIAAGVAAVSIFWLRDSAPQEMQTLQASAVAPTSIALTPEPASPVVAAVAAPGSEARLYTTPEPSSGTSLAPPARLANYVVAHSEYSGPLTRRMALLGIVGAESGDSAVVSPEAAAPVTESVDAP